MHKRREIQEAGIIDFVHQKPFFKGKEVKFSARGKGFKGHIKHAALLLSPLPADSSTTPAPLPALSLSLCDAGGESDLIREVDRIFKWCVWFVFLYPICVLQKGWRGHKKQALHKIYIYISLQCVSHSLMFMPCQHL